MKPNLIGRLVFFLLTLSIASAAFGQTDQGRSADAIHESLPVSSMSG